MELYCKGKEMWEASSFLLEHTTFQKGFTSEKKKKKKKVYYERKSKSLSF